MGFVDVLSTYKNDKLSFSFGEQDLFITSELTDKISFLGETVFKFDPESNTDFSISVERVIIRYNLKGNHYLVLGKHHTPLNYWNETYHHGRVFSPNIFRPLVFQDFMIPLHTTGIGFQGTNLTKINLGYDLLVGNGIGSGDLEDNDKYKSITASVHIKPYDGLRLGVSYYNDVISEGVVNHHGPDHEMEGITEKITQQIFTGSFSFFKKKVELLAEGTFVNNTSDSLGSQNSMGLYAHAGYRIHPKIIPYVRYDNVDYAENDMWFHASTRQSFIGGMRYEFSYLAVLKAEYQYNDLKSGSDTDSITLQFAIGF
ncbi:MAG TPA: hypothetical protein PKD91_04280 [Bacteroidia bacterium]|nr:hypothetical protein [Bacteroidia bacterium]